jgi:hypothetical protein
VNRPVQEALVAWNAQREARTMFGVLRQCATGNLLLDGTESTIADRSKPFQPGDRLTIGAQTDAAGKRLLVAFTDNDRLAEYRTRGGSTTPPLSIGQPAAATLQLAATDYDGIAIDPGSPETLCIAYAAEIRQGLTDDAEVNEALKTAIGEGRPTAAIIAAAEAAPVVFVGVDHERDEQGEPTDRVIVPGVTGPDGRVYGAGFTTPAEVWAWGPELEARPTRFANIARVAIEDGQAGVVLNPVGPVALIPAADLPGRDVARNEVEPPAER